MSPSDKLRALLDGAGIEYGSGFGGDTLWTGRDAIEWRWDKQENILAMYSHTITPEQTIAATVGNRTDLSKRLRKVHGLHAFAELFGFSWEDGSDWSWHDVACAMADAVDQQDEVERLKAKNAKLRAERDEWHRVAVSKQDIIDHMRDARAENAELRELVQDMLMCLTWQQEPHGYMADGCDHCRFRGKTNGMCGLGMFRGRARELGVEVSE